MLFLDEKSRDYHRKLFYIVFEYIKEMLLEQANTSDRARDALDYLLMDLLEHPDMNIDVIHERAAYLNYQNSHSFLVISLHSEIKKKTVEEYFIQELRSNLSSSQIFPYKGRIVIMYFLPSLGGNNYRKHLEKIFTPLLRNQMDKHPTIFISRVCSSLEQFPIAYNQTKRIFESCTSSPDLFFHYYEDDWIRDLFGNHSDNASVFSYCEQYLMDLAAQNTDKSRQQLHILDTYLYNDCKLSLTGELLGMHRNNVIYHIAQMERLYDVDFSDPEVRRKARLSLEILRASGYIGS